MTISEVYTTGLTAGLRDLGLTMGPTGRDGNRPVWEVVEQWLKAQGGKVTPRKVNEPKLTGGLPNPGYAPA